MRARTQPRWRRPSTARLAAADLEDASSSSPRAPESLRGPRCTACHTERRSPELRASHSYQTLENFVGLDYHNADRIHPEWQHLAPGDAMRLAPNGWFGLRDGVVTTVVDVPEQQSIVLRMTPPEHLLDAVWSFHLIPHWEDRRRL